MTMIDALPTTDLAAAYRTVRAASERLCDPLVTEDYVVQWMPDVSPAKWHLAHVTWFFETFVLTPHAVGYAVFDPAFTFLFNSYYVTVGDRHCRQNRGQLSRPTVADVYAYRRHVDDAMEHLLADPSPALADVLRPLMEIGIHHEQQHQELLLTDVKHVFWVNPLRPAYRPARPPADAAAVPMRWVHFDGGVLEVGHAGDGFAFDNESPRHKAYLEPFELGSRLVNNGEYKRFMADGGYARADCWLSAGLATAKAEDWRAPLYWIEQDGRWWNHTLSGLRPVVDAEPVCHLSYFEADAFARWAGARLPTEAEWEVASETVPMTRSSSTATATPPPPPTCPACNRCSATCGSGLPAPTSATPGSARRRGRWGNTTASSCVTSSCCAAGRSPRRRATSGGRTATSSRRTPGGSSWGCGWPAEYGLATDGHGRTRTRSETRPSRSDLCAPVSICG